MMQIGVSVISDGDDWPVSRGLMRAMRAEIARVRTPLGFGFSPDKVRDLIADGVRTIVLCTEDGDATPENTYSEIVERGFGALIGEFPAVRWVIEISNEPNMVNGLDMWTHRYFALETLKRLKPQMPFPNLRWSVSMPTNVSDMVTLLARDEHGCILDHIDVWTPHLYGWERLGDGAGDGGKWNDVLRYGLEHTSLPVIITEAGIDDRATHRTEKARRYLDWASKANPRIEGLCLWGLGRWDANPTYEINMPMALELGKRTTSPPPEPEPEPPEEPAEMIVRTTNVVNVPARISRDSFIRAYENTPFHDAAGDAYDIAVGWRVDPLFIKGVTWAESQDGTDPTSVIVRYDTKNPGNRRSTVTGTGQTIETDRGPFQQYPTVEDGFLDMIQALASPNFVYAKEGRDTVETIGYRYAPPTDPHKPDQTEEWIRNTLAEMNRRFEGDQQEQEPPPVARQLRIALAAGHHNNDGGNTTEYKLVGPITKAYADEFRRQGCDVRVVTPDDGLGFFDGGLQGVAQVVVDWANAGWVADLFLECHTEGVANENVRGVFAIYPDWGDDVDADVRDTLGPAISNAISAATGIPVRGSGTMSEKSTGVGIGGSRLGVFLRTAPIRATTTRLIVEHGSHSSPDDLAILRQPDTAGTIATAGVKAVLDFFGAVPGTVEPPPAVTERRDPVTDVLIGGGFRQWYERLERLVGPEEALEIVGRFLTDEFTDAETGLTVQYTERARLEHQPGSSAERFDVVLGRLGAEILAARP